MGLTFKIAIGVFIGAIGAFLAINAPAWIQQSRREGWYAEAREAVHGLTPDVLIERCGKPQKDLTDKAVHTRFMYYEDGLVVLAFWQDKDGSWHFQSMQHGEPIAVNGVVLADGGFIKADEGKDNKEFNEVAMLPCLGEKESR